MELEWEENWPDKDRTTQELMITLADDVARCHEALVRAIDAGVTSEDGSVDADYEFYARQLIRAIFANIEAVTFSVKVSCVYKLEEKGEEVPAFERYAVLEIGFRLDKSGEVLEVPMFPELASSIRFMFLLLERLHGEPNIFDPSVEWWSCLRESIQLRNRLMHPQLPHHIDISGDEIVKALKASDGFRQTILKYADLIQTIDISESASGVTEIT